MDAGLLSYFNPVAHEMLGWVPCTGWSNSITSLDYNILFWCLIGYKGPNVAYNLLEWMAERGLAYNCSCLSLLCLELMPHLPSSSYALAVWDL